MVEVRISYLIAVNLNRENSTFPDALFLSLFRVDRMNSLLLPMMFSDFFFICLVLASKYSSYLIGKIGF